MTNRVRALLGASLVVALVAAVVVLRARPHQARVAQPEEYAGDASCVSCHQEQASARSTAHARTSAPATAATIAGSFADGENVLTTINPYLHFRMERKPDGFYQTAVEGAPPHPRTLSQRFDIVIGSGRKGQSYLYWKGGDELFQLPVSYWTELRGWISSPGYQEGLLNFERPIGPRCLECHATFFEHVPGSTNRYDPESPRLGVTCESCHGPGGEHVARQRSPFARVRGQAIINPAELPRARQVDGCALCHAGIGEPQAPAFSYRSTEPLARHLALPWQSAEEPDVHGNQVALLQRSACFQASDMTCATCHNVHQTQREAASFSNRCLSCHQVQSCGLFPVRGEALAQNCVDCHMPQLPTNQIVSSRNGRQVRPKVRTHWIRVYGDGISGQ